MWFWWLDWELRKRWFCNSSLIEASESFVSWFRRHGERSRRHVLFRMWDLSWISQEPSGRSLRSLVLLALSSSMVRISTRNACMSNMQGRFNRKQNHSCLLQKLWRFTSDRFQPPSEASTTAFTWGLQLECLPSSCDGSSAGRESSRGAMDGLWNWRGSSWSLWNDARTTTSSFPYSIAVIAWIIRYTLFITLLKRRSVFSTEILSKNSLCEIRCAFLVVISGCCGIATIPVITQIEM